MRERQGHNKRAKGMSRRLTPQMRKGCRWKVVVGVGVWCLWQAAVTCKRLPSAPWRMVFQRRPNSVLSSSNAVQNNGRNGNGRASHNQRNKARETSAGKRPYAGEPHVPTAARRVYSAQTRQAPTNVRAQRNVRPSVGRKGGR